MSEVVEIVVAWDVQRLSPNVRLHYMARAGAVKSARLAAKAGWYEAGCPLMDGPVEVSLLVRRGRAIDPDNALAGAKAILDQLLTIKHAGCAMVPDDSAANVSYQPVQFDIDKKWRGKEEVVVRITPLETKL